MDEFARAVKLAAKYREESWDGNEKLYKLSLYKAADKAAREVGFDTRGARPIYLLLDQCWDEILDWADWASKF